jgi:hypothetical protein
MKSARRAGKPHGETLARATFEGALAVNVQISTVISVALPSGPMVKATPLGPVAFPLWFGK